MLRRLTLLLAISLIAGSYLFSQVTTSSITGIVKDSGGQPLVGATVTATHEPSGTVSMASTTRNGAFLIQNLRPGGPYTVKIDFVGQQSDILTNVYLQLGEPYHIISTLNPQVQVLENVLVSSRRAGTTRIGPTTNISRDKIANLPTVSRNMNDFLRMTPQAKITSDGGISIAGQNNRYNAFYIDGAINNDVFGLAASGTNGGQANINPISIDAIDQFQVMVSPYDASIGGFTGGGINATTRSGTNTYTGSAWFYYRNEDLAGKTPGNIEKSARTKLNELTNKNYGFRVGGPIIKNKLFFFILGEVERNIRPQPFDFGEYRGNGTLDSVAKLVNFLQTSFGYDPGSFLDNPEEVNADRLTAKIDWNINTNHRLAFSYRLNDGERFNTSSSSSTTINFFNNGYLFPNATHTGTIELRSNLKKQKSNRLLVTYTKVTDNRDPLGSPFPRVTINDGSGRYVFGTENFSTGNLLEQKNWTFLDVFRFNLGNHSFSVGTDNLYSDAYNLFIRDLYGNYTYASLNDFITNQRPTRYDHTFSLLEDKTEERSSPSAAAFSYLNLAFFANDEIKFSDRFTINLGIRADKTKFLDDPRGDAFFNDTAITILSQYYDLHGARSGQMSKVPWAISPRFGFTYRVTEEDLTIRGGAGLFSGRMPLVWPGGVYNNTGVNLGTVGVNNPNITFRADPFDQYGPSDFGINLTNAKGQVDLISGEFKLPKIFRISLGADKKLSNTWTISFEGIYTKNINEIYYQNINILPPTLFSEGPGRRSVYSFSGSPTRPGLRPNNVNPYSGGEIFLLYNNPNKKGFSYNFSAAVEKVFSKGFTANISYTYGNSVVTNEGTSSQNNSQWRFMETVNGRNFVELSRSDFALGHRFFAYLSKKISYLNNKLATTITLTYNGQSGNPFSYVYTASMVGDRSRGETNDLIYIPTAAELQAQVFLSNTTGGVTYTPDQQKALLEEYIQGDRYLRTHRGQFAERNGSRLPFTHQVDLGLKQDFNVKIGKKTYQLQLTYDIYNFTNMLNRKWGQTYFLSNDNYSLIQFAGFVSASNLTPQYRFNPQRGKPWGISTSTSPGLSARWISQVGARINF